MRSPQDEFIAKARRNMAFAAAFGAGSIGLATYGVVAGNALLSLFCAVFACLNVALFVVNRNAVRACRQGAWPQSAPPQAGRPDGGAALPAAKRGPRQKPAPKGKGRRRQRPPPPPPQKGEAGRPAQTH